VTARGSQPSLRILHPRPAGFREEGDGRDPRGQRSPSSAHAHATSGAAGQCHPCLPGGRDLADLVLPLAAAIVALWPRRPAASAHPSHPVAPPGDPGPGARRAGVRAAVADPRAGADRRATPAASLGSVAGQCVGRVRDPHAPWLADPLGAADPPGSAGGRGPRPADRADAPAGGPPPCRRAASRRPGLRGRGLRREAQGGRQSLATDGLRCRLLVRDCDARATGDPGHGHRVSCGPT
jgi:hypothetical protein